MTRTVLRAVCLLVLSGILVAGLWPFHAPKNEVSWLSHENGILFGEYGSIVSEGVFNINGSKEAAPCSLELWLQPDHDYSGTILAFYQPENLVVPFELWQSHHNLGMQRTSLDHRHHTEETTIYVSDLFRHAKSVFVTISSGPSGTAIYADGLLVKNSPNLRFSTQDLTGQLILGNSPRGAGTWSGQLKGIAVYDRELTTGEVSQHYTSWTKNMQRDLVSTEGVVALYLFDEGKGSVVHNRVNAATNLLIPERFFVLRQPFLESAWSEFLPTRGYWKNIATNIAGFVPFGFFFRAYFSSVRKVKGAVALTVALGFIVSLTIEVLQAFLPTRQSGTTDLITNTFGTALGTTLWAWTARHGWFVRACVSIDSFAGEERENLQFVE
jgi:hypothetical protein